MTVRSIIFLAVALVGLNWLVCAKSSTISHQALHYYNTAVDLSRHGFLSDAIIAYENALSLSNEFPEAHQNIAILYEQKGRIHEAVVHTVLSVNSATDIDFRSRAVCNLVSLLNKVHLLASNVVDTSHILTLLSDCLQQTNNPDAIENLLYNTGLVLENIGRYDNAKSFYERVIDVRQNHSLALIGLGNINFLTRNFSAVSDYYLRALEAMDAQDIFNQLQILNNLGMIERERGNLNSALSYFNSAYSKIVPEDVTVASDLFWLRQWSLSNVFTIMGMLSYWGSNFEKIEDDVLRFAVLAAAEPQRQIPSMDPYTFSLIRFASLDNDLGTNTKACSLHYQGNGGAISRVCGNGRKSLRVGYLSFDWRDHPMGRLTRSLVVSHSHRVESISISYGYFDGTELGRYVRKQSPAFLDISKVGDDEAITALTRLDLDIVIDLTGHTYNNRIGVACHKPGAILVNYLGFPGSTGCLAFDYAIVQSDVAPPESARYLFSEKLIYLPDTYQANAMPITVRATRCSRRFCRQSILHNGSGDVAAINETWICSFNSNKKFEPSSWRAWMNILARVPKSILVLLVEDKLIQTNLRMEAVAMGLSLNRLIFLSTLSWTEHLDRIVVCDLIIDTFVYGAHTTATDAMWMNTPIFALDGWGSGRMPSRVAAALMRSLIGRTTRGLASIFIHSTVRELEDAIVRYCLVNSSRRILSQIRNRRGATRTFDAALMQTTVEHSYQLIFELSKIRAPQRFHIVVDTLNGPDKASIGTVNCQADSLPAYCDGSKLCELLIRNALVVHHIDSLLVPTSWSNCRLQASVSVNCTELRFRMQELATELPFGNLSSNLLFCIQDIADLREGASFINSVVALQYALEKHGKCADEQNLLRGLFEYLFLPISGTGSVECSQNSDVFQSNSSICFRLGLNGSRERILSPLLSRLYESQNSSRMLNPIVQNWPIICNEFVVGLDCSHYRLRQDYDLISSDLLRDLSLFLINHVICTQAAGKGDHDLNSWLLLAYQLDPNPQKLLYIGKLFEDSVNLLPMLDLGFAAVAGSVVATHQNRFGDAIKKSDTLSSYINISTSNRLLVVFYCFEYGNEWWPNWGPSSAKNGGLGGSEEAVVYMAEQLIKLGVQVEVYADSLEHDRGQRKDGHTWWRHYSEFDIDREIDVFVAWRYVASLALGRSASKRFVWLHDLVPVSDLIAAREITNGYFVQSSFHASTFGLNPAWNLSPTSLNFVIIPNGLSDLSPCMNSMHRNTTFVYASSPRRGLEQVLLSWRYIKAAIPNATLTVFYGFSAAVIAQISRELGSTRYQQWYTKISVLLQQDGVIYKGPVSHHELTHQLGQSGFILYPTKFQETGCITVTRAMACGVFPITSRRENSVLPTLTRNHDFGPVLTERIAMQPESYMDWLYNEWIPAVLVAASMKPDELDQRRKLMIEYARSTYSWELSAGIMLSAMQSS